MSSQSCWISDESIYILLSAPLVGKYLPVVGVKLTYPIGAVTMALSYASFGCLYWVEDVNIFLTVSYVLRCPTSTIIGLASLKPAVGS